MEPELGEKKSAATTSIDPKSVYSPCKDAKKNWLVHINSQPLKDDKFVLLLLYILVYTHTLMHADLGSVSWLLFFNERREL